MSPNDSATPEEPQADSIDTGPTAPTADASPEGTPIQTADLIEGYHVIAEWIRFADAKAAVVLTVGGAIAGLFIPSLHTYLQIDEPHITPWWTGLVSVLFGLWLFLLVLSGVWSFLCILPFRTKGQHPALGHCSHFHPAAIASRYQLAEANRFQKACAQLGDPGLRDEVAACLLIDSHISAAKYKRVTTSIRLMAASIAVGLVYLIAIQF